MPTFSPQARYVSGDPLALDYTPSGADVQAGDVVIIGIQAFYATVTLYDGLLGTLYGGQHVVDFKKKANDTGTAKVTKWYWDDTNNYATTTAAGNTFIGLCVDAAAASDATVRCLMPAIPLGT